MKVIKVKVSDSFMKNLCKCFRADTEQCVSGCKEIQVVKGASCPYGDDNSEAQNECPCYK